MLVYFSLILALSIDTFIIAITYENEKIKIPLSSNIVISLICSLSLAISLIFGNIFSQILPINILKIFSFTLLFLIGIYKIIEEKIKQKLSKNKTTKINKKKDKILSIPTAIILSITLSIDGIIAALAFQTTNLNILIIFLASFITNFLFILSAKFFAKLNRLNFEYLGGIILIILAFSKI